MMKGGRGGAEIQYCDWAFLAIAAQRENFAHFWCDGEGAYKYVAKTEPRGRTLRLAS